MAANPPSGNASGGGTPCRLWARRILALFLLLAVMDLILFAAAGRLDWPWAWLWTLMYGAFLLAYLLWGTRNAPGLLQERSRVAANVKGWDKAIGAAYTALLLALLVAAGLDAGRFRWTHMPVALHLVGVLGLAFAGGVIGWTILENSYLSRWARIQDDRGQRVVTSGPYQYVRHPMYAALIVFMVSLALELGSGWALVPAGLIGVLYVIRTALEDRMLQAGLPGYREYAGRVRYRLLPGVW